MNSTSKAPAPVPLSLNRVLGDAFMKSVSNSSDSQKAQLEEVQQLVTDEMYNIAGGLETLGGVLAAASDSSSIGYSD